MTQSGEANGRIYAIVVHTDRISMSAGKCAFPRHISLSNYINAIGAIVQSSQTAGLALKGS